MPDNPMRKIGISKVVVNIGSGNEEKQADAARRLIELVTGRKPADEISKNRRPAFKITRGQRIGAYVTLRGKTANETLKRLLDAADNKVKLSGLTTNSLSFGIREYIDIRGVKYDPSIGMLGMNVNVSFSRKGRRVSARKRLSSKIPARHAKISADEIKEYMAREFKAEFN